MSKYRISAETNGLGEVLYFPQYIGNIENGGYWCYFSDKRQFATLDAAKQFLSKMVKEDLRKEYQLKKETIIHTEIIPF